ncbi:hypothetical protein [Pedobacter frigoris]|uniref:hypothetical protein n=1 Tax=Pedobacter frigoris TaxID=2571272 RepID=UPI00292D3A6C|nr:hypothetical protein [Pedobacter frigoris]
MNTHSNPPVTSIISFLILFILSSCNADKKINALQANPVAAKSSDVFKPYAGTGKLIAINFNDSNYADVSYYAIDTTTQDGWSIKYLIKDDSTRYSDLYIEWSKNKSKGLYHFPDVLTFRRYFIPFFEGENKKHLFFTHACATHCSAVLTLSKEKFPKYREFISIANFNIPNGQIVYTTYKDYDSQFVAAIADLNKGVERPAVFKNSPLFLEPMENIDSISFSSNQVKLFATLIDRNDTTRKKTVKEIQVVKF